jgi:hypothetical protein
VRLDREVPALHFHLAQERVEETPRFVFEMSVHIEAAIRTELRAEGDVEIQMTHHAGSI